VPGQFDDFVESRIKVGAAIPTSPSLLCVDPHAGFRDVQREGCIVARRGAQRDIRHELLYHGVRYPATAAEAIAGGSLRERPQVILEHHSKLPPPRRNDAARGRDENQRKDKETVSRPECPDRGLFAYCRVRASVMGAAVSGAQFQEHVGMPMREEIYIPEGQPLGLPQTSAKARPRLLDDPDFNVMSAVIGIALLVAYYLALNCPLPDDMSAIFPMI
jgi:hypothetical protein